MNDSSKAQFLQAADAVRASGVLRRSRLLIDLFDYLVSRSADGQPATESEIARDVFGKTGVFETGRDAVVRVYVHRLRRRLEDHAGQAGGYHLSLPKGEYRIVGQGAAHPSAPTLSTARPRQVDRRWMVAALAALVALNLGAWALAARNADPVSEARRSPVWRPFTDSRFPLLLVVGDYYIVGDTEGGVEVARLVREFQVNSPRDLGVFLLDRPDKAQRYVDLGLSYLPISSAGAVANIAPLFAGDRPIRVVTASALTPEMLKTYDVIYIGYVSGMGLLRDAAFSSSRFQAGDSFDELRDTATRKRYLSQAALGPSRGEVYRDYGYASVFPGPAGNHIAVVAGFRDIGALAVAEQMTQRDSLRALRQAVGRGGAFEALYEVRGQGEVNFQARLLTAAPRKAPADWSDPPG